MPISNQRIRVDLEQGAIPEGLFDTLKFLQNGGQVPIHVSIEGAEGLEQIAESLKLFQTGNKIGLDFSEALAELKGFENAAIASAQKIKTAFEIGPTFSKAFNGIQRQAETAAEGTTRAFQKSTNDIERLAQQLAKSKLDLTSTASFDNASTNALFDTARIRAQQIRQSPEFQVSQLARTKTKLDSLSKRFGEEVSGEEFVAGLLGGNDARRAVRTESVNRTVNANQNVFGLEESLKKQNELPPLFNPANLLKPANAISTAFAGLQGAQTGGLLGGIGGLAAGALGAASPLGGAGALIASTLEQVITQPVTEFVSKFKQNAEEIKRAGLEFSQGVTGIGASINSASQAVRNGKPLDIGESFTAQQAFARSVIEQSQRELSSVGIGGEQGATLTRAVQTSLTRKFGAVPDADLTALTAKAVGGAFAVVDPSGLNNSSITQRDTADILLGLPAAQRSQLGSKLGPTVLSEIGRARTPDQLKQGLAPLLKFAQTFETSNEPAVLQQRLNAAQQLNSTISGRALTENEAPFVARQTDIERDASVVAAQKKLSSITGAVSGFFNTIAQSPRVLGSDILNLATGDFSSVFGAGKATPQSPGKDVDFVQNARQKLDANLERLQLTDKLTSFQDKFSPAALSSVIDDQLKLAQGSGDDRAAALINLKRGAVRNIQAAELAGISTATPEGRLQSIASQRTGIGSQIDLAQQEIAALREQLPKASDTIETKRIGGNIVDVQQEMLALKAKERDLAQQQYEQLASAAQKTASVFRFADSATGLESGKSTAINQLQQALATAQTQEDQISARLELNSLKTADPQSIRLKEALAGTETATFAGRERALQLQAQLAKNDIDRFSLENRNLTQRNATLNPSSSEFIANRISIESNQKAINAARVAGVNASRDQATLPFAKQVASADLELALSKSSRLIEDEASKRALLNASLDVSRASLAAFDEHLKAQSSSRELQLANLIKQAREEGAVGLPTVTDSDIEGLKKRNTVDQINALLRENGSQPTAAAFGAGFSPFGISANSGSLFDLQQKQERLNLEERARQGKIDLEDLPAEQARHRAQLGVEIKQLQATGVNVTPTPDNLEANISPKVEHPSSETAAVKKVAHADKVRTMSFLSSRATASIESLLSDIKQEISLKSTRASISSDTVDSLINALNRVTEALQ